MRLKFTIPIFLLGACTSVDEDTTPSWFEGWSPLDDSPQQGASATHFMTADLPQGAMTFGALTAEGEPVEITSGVASYREGTTTVYLSDGARLYRLESDTLTVTALSSFVDPSGPVTGVTSMHRVMLDDTELVLVRTADRIRILDVSTQKLSVPLHLLEWDTATGELSAFEPTAMTIVPSFLDTLGTPYVAVGNDGLLRVGREVVVSDQIVVSFQILPIRLTVCASNDTIVPEQLLAPIWPEASSLGPEHILMVSEGMTWVLDRDLCVYPLGEILDQSEDAVIPVTGFEVDFNDDGFDSVLWVHQ